MGSYYKHISFKGGFVMGPSSMGLHIIIIRYNNNKMPFQIKFTYVICCGDGSALPGIEHRVTRRGESEKKHTKKGTKNFSFDEKEGIQLWRKIIYAN